MSFITDTAAPSCLSNVQAMPSSWDAAFDDLVQLETPEAATQHTNTSSDLFGDWRFGDHQWTLDTSQPLVRNEDISPSRRTSDAATPDQIDELRRSLGIVVGSEHPKQQSGYDAFDRVTQPTSFTLTGSSNHPNGFASYPSSGYSTPADLFDISDDSPIYSRRTSAASITSIPARRGERIPGGYPCDQCDQRFDVPSQLRHHRRKHLPRDRRPHPCEECGDRFLYPKDVTRHKRQKHSDSGNGQSTTSARNSISLDQRSSAVHLSPDDRRHRRRAMPPERRSAYIRHLEASIRQKDDLIKDLHSGSATPDLRRDSAIADVGAEDAASSLKASQLLDTIVKQQGTLHDLSATTGRQRHEILQLRTDLHRTTENAQTWQKERDAFAEFFTHMSASFDFHSEAPQVDSSSLASRAKGWLNAIEMLISTSLACDGEQTQLALRHISSVLDG